MTISWGDRLIAASAFLGFFSAYLILARGPANNQAQLIFRMSIAALGVILGIVGLILRSKAGGDAK